MECACKHSTAAGDCSASRSALSSGTVVSTCIFWYRLTALPILDTLNHGVPGLYPHGLQPKQIARNNAEEDLQGEVKWLTPSCTACNSWNLAKLSCSQICCSIPMPLTINFLSRQLTFLSVRSVLLSNFYWQVPYKSRTGWVWTLQESVWITEIRFRDFQMTRK